MISIFFEEFQIFHLVLQIFSTFFGLSALLAILFAILLLIYLSVAFAINCTILSDADFKVSLPVFLPFFYHSYL